MIAIRILGCRAEIDFQDRRLAPALAYLGHGVPDPLPVRKTLRYEVRGTAPYLIHEEGDFLQEVASPEDVLFVVYSRIHRRAIERFVLSGWVVYHAALASVAGRRVLLLGDSGAGKTTLALRLLLAGHHVEGDELVLEREGKVLALPRAFHLKAGIERDVPEVAGVLESLPHMANGDVRALDPSRVGLEWSVAAPGPVDELVWIAPNHGGETSLEQRPPYRAIRRTLKAAPGWGEPRARVVASAARLGRGGGHRLRLGDARSAVVHLEALTG